MSRILASVIERHVEDAAFLWLRRDRAFAASYDSPARLIRLERRIEANLDGLRVAGDEGWRMLIAALVRYQEPGEMFAAAVIALESGRADWLAVLISMADKVVTARRGLSGAIGWVAPTNLRSAVAQWSTSNDRFFRYLAVLACSHHRADPGPRLVRWLRDPEALVRARALRLVGELGRSDLGNELTVALTDDPEDGCRRWAAWSATILGDGAALLLVRTWDGADYMARTLDVAARWGGLAEARDWVRRLSVVDLRQALRAAGIVGDPAVVSWLIEQTRESTLASSAANSIVMITGVDLSQEGLALPPSAELVASPQVGDEDAAEASDSGLPRPDTIRLASWWAGCVGRFPAGVRHLAGRPIEAAFCSEILASGRQNHRRAAAYELAKLRPGTGVPSWNSRLVRG